MNTSFGFTRVLFIACGFFIITGYSAVESGNWLFSGAMGLCCSALLIIVDIAFQRIPLRIYNLTIIGLFVGYLMGKVILLVSSPLLELLPTVPQELIKMFFYLSSLYLGMLMTLRASDQFYLSIPFVRLFPVASQKKDLLVDVSVLLDARIIDLCSSGLFDRLLLVPRFLLQDLYSQVDLPTEGVRTKARKALDVLKRLESLPDLALRYNDTDFSETNDLSVKMARLARLLNANLLISDVSRTQTLQIEGAKVVNLQILSYALKPMMQSGEQLKIKIQRYGKEPMQGVGYLDDGTMVVVNGGGQYLGETIGAWVLSMKHTSSGRIVFCHAEEGVETYAHESADE